MKAKMRAKEEQVSREDGEKRCRQQKRKLNKSE
jgi:hypothetical protein